MKKLFSLKLILIILYFFNFHCKHLKNETYKLLEKNINNKEINKLSNNITNISNFDLDYVLDDFLYNDLINTIYYRTTISLITTILLIIIVLVILNYLIKISNTNDIYNNFCSISEEQIKLLCNKNKN